MKGKQTRDAIVKACGRKPKSGVTSAEIAARVGKSTVTVREHLAALVAEGVIKIVGTYKTGRRGHPSNLYAPVR